MHVKVFEPLVVYFSMEGCNFCILNEVSAKELTNQLLQLSGDTPI